MKRLPLEPAGWVVAAIGLVSGIAAYFLRWPELAVLAAGSAAALIVAIPFVVGRTKLRLQRKLIPQRVTRGEPAYAELKATNASGAPATRRILHDFVDGRAVPIHIPTLGPGESTIQTWPLPTSQRGVREIGPARITKADPFRLMQREVGQTEIEKLWVQPRVIPIAAFAAGMTKDIEGPTHDTSPAGDVAFHAVRPYRMGDDARHVHWMATARTGEMMMRHYVDNRQPLISVVLDNAASSYATAADFDVAVDIAGSIGVSALVATRPVSLYVGAKAVVGRQRPASRETLLDDLTLANTVDDFDFGYALPRLVAAERETSIVVAITGAADLNTLLEPVSRLRRTTEVMVVLVDAAGPMGDANVDETRRVGSLAGSRVFTVASVDEFAALVDAVAVR